MAQRTNLDNSDTILRGKILNVLQKFIAGEIALNTIITNGQIDVNSIQDLGAGASTTNTQRVVMSTDSNIDVNIVHNGTDPSSIRIGDGTTLVGVTTSNELKVSQSSSGGGHIINTALQVGTLEAIDVTSHVCKLVTVSCPVTNTGYIIVGFSTATATTGIPLYPGESKDFPVNNSNLIYAMSEIAGEDVAATYFN